MGLLDKIFGSYTDRELKKIVPIAKSVMALEEEYAALTDEQLRGKTAEFKTRLSDGETLDALLPEAFATAREAAWRVLGMKPFYVQVIGGIVLHQGRIAEMKTGEGKTLVAVLPAYLNALAGEGERQDDVAPLLLARQRHAPVPRAVMPPYRPRYVFQRHLPVLSLRKCHHFCHHLAFRRCFCGDPFKL